MTIKLPKSVIDFAAGNTEVFEGFVDFWNQYRSETTDRKYSFALDDDGKRIPLSVKEKAVNESIMREVARLSGVDMSSMPPEQAASHPLVSWAVGNISSQLIDAVLPQTMVEGTSAYAEVITKPYGESALFEVKSRHLFPVSKAGRLGQREGEMQKGFTGFKALNPEDHIITVGVNMFRVLAGEESLADFTTKAIRSIETEMTKDIYTAFYTAMGALSTNATTGLRVSGYTQLDMTKLAQRVSGYMGGAKPILLGTKVALANVIPDDVNTRAQYDSDYVKLGYLRTIAGIDTFEIPQIANWSSPFSTYVADDRLWIVAPGTDKLVKCVIGGSTITHVDDQFKNADLQQNFTIHKMWKAGVITSAIGAEIDL